MFVQEKCHARGKKKANVKWQLHNNKLITLLNVRHFTCTTIHYLPNLFPISTSLYHFTHNTLHGFCNSCMYGLNRNFTYAPHHLFCITNMFKTLNHFSHKTPHKLHTTIGSLAHEHMLPLTNKKSYHLPHACMHYTPSTNQHTQN